MYAGTETPKSKTPTTTPKKDGRGRPRKSLPANGESKTASTTTTPKKKDGRGRPRKSLPANGDSGADEMELTQPYTVPKEDTGRSYWLMKAEPESRFEKGVDVKFSIDDLAAADTPEPWDGMFRPFNSQIFNSLLIYEQVFAIQLVRSRLTCKDVHSRN